MAKPRQWNSAIEVESFSAFFCSSLIQRVLKIFWHFEVTVQNEVFSGHSTYPGPSLVTRSCLNAQWPLGFHVCYLYSQSVSVTLGSRSFPVKVPWKLCRRWTCAVALKRLVFYCRQWICRDLFSAKHLVFFVAFGHPLSLWARTHHVVMNQTLGTLT